MTRRGLMVRISIAVLVLVAVIALGCDIRFRYPKRDDLHYVLFRDLVPLIIAIPAAWLAYCFQRRSSYLEQLRSVTQRTVGAVHAAIRYTRMSRPSVDDRSMVLSELDVALDGLRAVDRPLRANRDLARGGPLDALLSIRDRISRLAIADDHDPAEAAQVRLRIEETWAEARSRLFAEFDRGATPSTRRTGRSATAGLSPSTASGSSRLTTHRAGR